MRWLNGLEHLRLPKMMNLITPYIEVNTRQDKLGIAKKKKEGAK